MSAFITVKRALISVSDKQNIIHFASALSKKGITLLSTGGTSAQLRTHQIPVTDIADYTHFPEILEGRVKTLHPKVHAAILRRPSLDDDVLKEHAIEPIDLVVVNLYPFEKVTAIPTATLSDAIENIDIGGPAMIRSAAKNYQTVCVVVDPADYSFLINELDSNQGKISLATRFKLAQKAFSRITEYDAAISNYLNSYEGETNSRTVFPTTISYQFTKKQELRYGENPHQKAAFYQESQNTNASITHAEQLQGKALSYNNIADADAAFNCVKQFTEQNACVIVKHANPCGVALGDTILAAYQRAYQCDPTSAYGGIIAFNKEVTEVAAKFIIENQFVEVVIAPSFEENALNHFSTKSNIRLLRVGKLNEINSSIFDFKKVSGGLLLQEEDLHTIGENNLQIVSQRLPNAAQINDLLFAWKVAKYVKSNAIVYAKNEMTLGIGAGQMSRVDSARIAAIKAAEHHISLQQAAMASDAFFPFRDSIDAAAKEGIIAIIQPGGSKRDEDIIRAADEHNMIMVFTHIRHFRH